MLQGEVKQISVEFTNSGQVPLKNITVACTHPNFFTFGNHNKTSTTLSTSAAKNIVADIGSGYSTLSPDKDTQEFILKRPEIKFIQRIELENGVLHPGKTVAIPMWICGPCNFHDDAVNVVGGGSVITPASLAREFETHLLFKYEPLEIIPNCKMR